MRPRRVRYQQNQFDAWRFSDESGNGSTHETESCFSHELHRESCNRCGGKTKAEHLSPDFRALTAWSYNIPFGKCVVRVNIRMRQHRGSCRSQFRSPHPHLRVSRLARVRIDHGQRQIPVAQRSGSFQSPERRWLAVAIVTNVRGGEDRSNRLPTLMSSVDRKYVSYRGHDEAVFMSQIKTIQTIDQLRTIRHRNFLRMAVKDVERHAAENGVAKRRHLLQLITGRGLASRLVPRTPLVHDQFDRVLRVFLAHDLPVSFDESFHAIPFAQ